WNYLSFVVSFYSMTYSLPCVILCSLCLDCRCSPYHFFVLLLFVLSRFRWTHFDSCFLFLSILSFLSLVLL
ncbi:hypothetical protein C8J56DRAFT_978287, partial [Mycena floridula]